MALFLGACSPSNGIRGEYLLQDATVCIDGITFQIDDMVGHEVSMALLFHSSSIISLTDDRGNDGALGRYTIVDDRLSIKLDDVEDTLRFKVLRATPDTLILLNVIPERMLVEYMAFPSSANQTDPMDESIKDAPLGAYTNSWHNMIDDPKDSISPDQAQMKLQSLRRAIQNTHYQSLAGKRQHITAFDSPQQGIVDNAELTLTLVHRQVPKRRSHN